MDKIVIMIMRLIFLAVLLAGSALSCRKDDVLSVVQQGKYEGSFQRETPGVVRLSTVTISFDTDTWSGTSDVPQYPALCNGSYKVNGEKISFANSCAFTADFDWTLILNGDYLIKSNNKDSLVFTRDYNGSSRDIYRLKRQ